MTFYLAVGSPLDPLGREFSFFCPHDSAQYTDVYLPFFVLLGLPKELVDHFFPSRPFIEMSLRFLTHPIIAGLLFTLVFSFWHVGVFYEAAIRDKVIHMAEHLSMFFVSLLMWWPICAPSDRLPSMRFGPQMLYILALMLGQTPIFAILTFSKDVLYDTYFYAERIMELTPIEDQKGRWRSHENC